MTRLEIMEILEALRSARSEIEGFEKTYPEYCTTGRLIEQLVKAETRLALEKSRLSKGGVAK